MNMSQSLKVNALGIAIFAAITALLIAVTYVFTKAPIERNIQKQQSAKLYEIIGNTSFDNDVYAQTISLPGEDFGYKQPIKAHVATLKGKVQTIIFPTITPFGYSGNIRLLIGINADERIAGVRVITHTETPGLGDKIELKKSPWILSFDNKQKESDTKWAVKKDGGQFDQFTGATITPRAIVNAVNKSLDYFMIHREQLLTAPTTIKHKGVENDN